MGGMKSFPFISDEGPGNLSHKAAASAAAAAGNTCSGHSVPTVVTAVALIVVLMQHQFSLLFLQPKVVVASCSY